MTIQSNCNYCLKCYYTVVVNKYYYNKPFTLLLTVPFCEVVKNIIVASTGLFLFY